jgi:hypothetical protein
LREHFVAHWILWKAYPNYLPLASAFLQMVVKNPKTEKITDWKISSRTYEALRTSVYELISEFNTDKVYVKDENGNSVCLSSEEYEHSDYKFHTTGKIYAYDVEDEIWKYIPTKEYHQNKNKFKSRIEMVDFEYGSRHLTKELVDAYTFKFLDIETGKVEKIQKKEAREKNKRVGYKRWKQIINHNYKCIDNEGNSYLINASDFDPQKNQHHRVGSTTAYDLLDKKHKSISLLDYYNSPTRYITTTKGKVLAKDQSGNRVLISKEKFSTGNYQGHTKGLRTVFDKLKQEYVQISEDEYLSHKDNYVGPNIGKVNVIDKVSGKRKQIPIELFDKKIFMGLGNKSQYFLAKNLLTDVEKKISIYEWNVSKDIYDILDQVAFDNAIKLL